MESTTIRINHDEKRKLEKLQAQIFLQCGKRLSFPELLHWLLVSTDDEILKRILEDLDEKSTKIDWDIHLEAIRDLGFDNSDDIDDVVYGE
jgi:hypothetical protein